MKNINYISVMLSLTSLFVSASAEAKVGDSVWAQCAWEKAPLAVKNWLSMPVPTWQTAIWDKNAALGHLLAASCATEPANELKPNRDFNWRQMASALKAIKQSNPASAETPQPVVKLCGHKVESDGNSALFRVDIIRENTDGSTLLVFQQHYASFEGQAVKLPQDLRMMPTEKDGKTSTDCKAIANDGSLIDA